MSVARFPDDPPIPDSSLHSPDPEPRRSMLLHRLSLLLVLLGPVTLLPAADWPQLQGDARRSGNAPGQELPAELGLVATRATSDAIFTAPVIGDGRVYVLDGSGQIHCLDSETLEERWTLRTPGPTRTGKNPASAGNVNNLSTPALVAGVLHVATQSGWYLALDARTGAVIRKRDLGEPVFAAIAVEGERVYVATLGARLLAMDSRGELRWTWDFVRERLSFEGDRWDGEAWAARGRRATWRDQFLVSRDFAVNGTTIVLPAGGEVVWLEDGGEGARHLGSYRGERESPCTLGLSIDESGRVFRQWHRRDNNGGVEILTIEDGQGQSSTVPGTVTSWKSDSLLSFTPVSLRDGDVYRCRPESGRGLVRHRDGKSTVLAGVASLTPPVLSSRHAIYGGLDGRVHLVPLDGEGPVRSLETAWGKPITAPVALHGGRIYAAGEDGYLYVWGSGGQASLPTRSLGLEKIRTPLGGEFTDSRHDWFTNFGNFQNTNRTGAMLRPPFKIDWIRRFRGTVKHFSVCGEGRLFTHTAEGQIFAVEQSTGRLLWRRHFPGVHVSFTAPLFHGGRLYVPQAGLESSWLRCLEADTGELVWKVPFTGSPSWNRQLPPIIHGDRIIYLFSTGRYPAEKWLFEHQNTFGFPADHRPILRAWDLATGEEAWSHDFHEYGAGGDDAGICLVDGTLYYSCYFGGEGKEGRPAGLTCALDPSSGEIHWRNTEHFTHAGCAISGEKLDDGSTRLYLGGYNPVEGKVNRIWCLDGADGSLVWRSDPVTRAIHVVTPTPEFLFAHSQYRHAYRLDRETGKVLGTMLKGYNCTRFTFSEPFILGANLDIYDTREDGELRLLSSGPAIDVLMCVGAFASNGRVYYSSNGGGIQVGMLAGEEARRAREASKGKD